MNTKVRHPEFENGLGTCKTGIVSRYSTARWAFFRLLGVTYVFAFWSLAGQVAGLVGQDGILPAGPSDAALRGVCIGGVAGAALLAAGVAPLLITPLLWLLYWWLSAACGEFLAFQWDALLLEAGLLAVFVAPAVWVDRFATRPEPPRAGVWLFQWLLFRLMFGSGVVKLASGDPSWRALTALTYHYETQPIPTPLAWYAHRLPIWFHEASAFATFVVELVCPWLIVVPRRLPRIIAALAFVTLQMLIAATGNYAFFNLLTASLCVFLVQDQWWRSEQPDRHAVPNRPHAIAAIAAAIIIVPVSLYTFASSAGIALRGGAIVEPVAALLAPLRSINSYGLFAVMTTTRPEIVVEGSLDGITWVPYEFKYKVGDVRRRPPWVAPFQPRLDWQMWFAALGRAEDNLWFVDMCAQLLQGSPQVRGLFAQVPFDKPAYIRAALYRYRFAAAAAHRTEGVWWTRERLGDYLPPLSLRVH